ncbi:glycoside hydrolase family 16 protein [Flavobacteriaceae bacterium]|nr:glycoside hydrolase family 16 protein [Flavobacteriaceae bacterium]
MKHFLIASLFFLQISCDETKNNEPQNDSEQVNFSQCSSGLIVDAYPKGNNNVLVWADEFEIDGRPCSKNWFHETVPPNNGNWWNSEFQHYTNREENSIVENGVLKIIARKENYDGKEYTSARINTMNLFEFKYGKVEVKARLPKGQGTWPAIWMLGASFEDLDWPFCGEIDILEHGNKQAGEVSSAVHLPDDEGNAYYQTNSIKIENESSDFHIYSMVWSENKIEFFVDGISYHVFQIKKGMPFDQPFFLLLNVAMGGDFTGNTVDPSFTDSVMEVDYVRVFQ